VQAIDARTSQEDAMTRFATLAALTLILGVSGLSARAAETLPQCKHMLSQYVEYAKSLGPYLDQARQQAEGHAIYMSDVAYYSAELADTQQCIKMLQPIATASR
jgi:hypothetical protein